MATRPQAIQPFEDRLVVYRSDEDGCWVAHSLRTDQVGTGDSIVSALADVIRAVYQVCATAEADDTIAYLREAPPEVQRLADRVEQLPEELVDEAARLAGGRGATDLRALFRAELRTGGVLQT